MIFACSLIALGGQKDRKRFFVIAGGRTEATGRRCQELFHRSEGGLERERGRGWARQREREAATAEANGLIDNAMRRAMNMLHQ